MTFKEFIDQLKENIKTYESKIKSSNDYEEGEFGEQVYSKFEDNYIEDIRSEYIPKIIKKVIGNDREFVRFYEVGEEENLIFSLKSDLSNKLELYFLNADENAFTDEIERAMFSIILEEIKYKRERIQDAKYSDVSNLDFTILDELFYLATKGNPITETTERFNFKSRYNYLRYRKEIAAQWEKLL